MYLINFIEFFKIEHVDINYFYLNHFQAWILQDFPRIFGWQTVIDYDEELMCAFPINPHRGRSRD